MRAFVISVVLVASGCLRVTQFRCEQDSDCGPGGVCQPVQYCSLPDPQCGGQRFVPSAGPYANQCVGATGDGGIADAPAGDGSTIDAPKCDGYAALGGAPGHVYKLVSTGDTWSNQASACTASSPGSAYLAIPDDANELDALDTLAGSAADYWVGISDLATPGTWQNTKNATQTFLPWTNGTPSPGAGKDCVEAITDSAEIDNTHCTTALPAICECEP